MPHKCPVAWFHTDIKAVSFAASTMLSLKRQTIHCREAIVEFLLGRCGSFADEDAEVRPLVESNLHYPIQ